MYIQTDSLIDDALQNVIKYVWFYILYVLCKNNLSLKVSQEIIGSSDAGMF